MFYHVFAALPEWAPLREDHILYSYGVLTSVQSAHGELPYTAPQAKDAEYLRLIFPPTTVTLDDAALPRRADGDLEWELPRRGHHPSVRAEITCAILCRTDWQSVPVFPDGLPIRPTVSCPTYSCADAQRQVLAAGVAAGDRTSLAKSRMRPPGKGVAYGFPAMENGRDAQRICVGARRGGAQW